MSGLAPVCELDHLVVLCASLADGEAWCRATLGLSPGPGGQHPLMGTHNRLLRLDGDGLAPAYLELIAINPEALPPERPRWFGLDAPSEQERLRQGGPRLAHAVLRTQALDALRQGLLAQGIDPGPALALSRPGASGLLQWRLLVRDDGAIGLGGHLPTLITWQGAHPTETMPANALRCGPVLLGGLPRPLQVLLGLPEATDAPVGLAGQQTGPAVTVTLQTPAGLRVLRSSP